jgi:hypothetical protein
LTTRAAEVSQNPSGGRLSTVAVNFERVAIDAADDDIFCSFRSPTAENDAARLLNTERFAVGGVKGNCIQ